MSGKSLTADLGMDSLAFAQLLVELEIRLNVQLTGRGADDDRARDRRRTWSTWSNASLAAGAVRSALEVCRMTGTARDPLLPDCMVQHPARPAPVRASGLPRSRLERAWRTWPGTACSFSSRSPSPGRPLNTTTGSSRSPTRSLDLYAQYRPTPLRRAVRLEERLDVNARIYYKYEGANLVGSHKLNTALAQTYYYARAGVKHMVTGTGAGQWGPPWPTRASSWAWSARCSGSDRPLIKSPSAAT